ncbi:MAG TPA: hypothetical protein VLG38_01690, partial [Gammaproteobacteria bacterium]|nr:hypothetical protein [Gammaproteobacteria bacterium]
MSSKNTGSGNQDDPTLGGVVITAKEAKKRRKKDRYWLCNPDSIENILRWLALPSNDKNFFEDPPETTGSIRSRKEYFISVMIDDIVVTQQNL